MNRIYIRTKTDTVLSLLTDVGPMTTAELMPLTGRCRNGIRDSLNRLRTERKVYIQAYQQQDTKGRRQPVYAAGDLEDAVEGSNNSLERNAKYRVKNLARIRAKNAIRRGSVPNMWAGLGA